LKYLGIDFGLSHLGFAVSDGEIAAPLATNVHVVPDETGAQPIPVLDKLIKKTIEIIRLHQIENIVIGISSGVMGETTRGFGEKLRELTTLPVFYQDEELTSVRAINQMVESGKRQSQRQVMDHNVAAANILQDYLDNLHEKKQV
jgi:putative transcription antitermination factor YqgF